MKAQFSQEEVMSKYLVVAQPSAAGPALAAALRRISAHDRHAEFSLLVPATPIEQLFTWTEGESMAAAACSAAELRGHVEREGLRVTATMVGDASVPLAIGDYVRDGGSYHALVVAAPRVSAIARWFGLDPHARSEPAALLDLSLSFAGPRFRSRPAESWASVSNAIRRAVTFICAACSSAGRDREHAKKQSLKGESVMP
jgi:hypothetical protein